MRIAKACLQCRTRKRKCSVGISGGRCNQCRMKDIHCSLSTDHIPPKTFPPPALIASPPGEDGISAELRVQLVVLYLDHLHGKPHTLFHPTKLRTSAWDGSLPYHVLMSIAALSCRFSNSEDIKLRKQKFIDGAKTSLKAQIDDFSLSTLQACILTGNVFGAEGDSSSESLFFAIAFRIAHIIKLSDVDTNDDTITQEEKVRAWWSLYMIDRWSSAGLNVPRQMPNDRFMLTPMDEVDFYASEPRTQIQPRKSGLWAQMVRIAEVFGNIQDLHKQHAAGELDFFQVQTLTEKLWGDLEAFSASLPTQHVLTRENLIQHAQKGLGRDFVALHLGFYHYATLLFFPYLDLQLGPGHSQKVYASRCKEHAAGLSDLLKLSGDVEGCEAVYFIVAHMTTVSSSALLHDLLFGDDGTIPATRARLEANFQVLVKIREIWPAAGMLTDRLFTFQKMCLQSTDPNTHKADKWMVKFLLQHAFPIDEKVPTEGSAAVVNGIDRGKFANDALSVLR